MGSTPEDLVDTRLTVKALGKEYPVYLDGIVFVTRLSQDGDEIRAYTWGELQEKAEEYKGTRFSLPFTTASGRNGQVTGFHSSNDNLLVSWADGRKTQEPGWSVLNDAMPRLADEDHTELTRLNDELERARKAKDAFVAERCFKDGIRAAAKAEQIRVAGLA